MQIFPHPKTGSSTSLAHWNECPLKATPFCNMNSLIQGFLVENNCGRDISLDRHYLQNERGTFKKEIPKSVAINGRFRLITVADDNPNAEGVKKNDIIVSSADINGRVDDKLLLVDRFNNKFVLYEYDGLSPNNNNRNQNHNNTRNGN